MRSPSPAGQPERHRPGPGHLRYQSSSWGIHAHHGGRLHRRNELKTFPERPFPKPCKISLPWASSFGHNIFVYLGVQGPSPRGFLSAVDLLGPEPALRGESPATADAGHQHARYMPGHRHCASPASGHGVHHDHRGLRVEPRGAGRGGWLAVALVIFACGAGQRHLGSVLLAP